MTQLNNRLNTVLRDINEALTMANRPADTVTLLAVSKTWPAAALRQLAEAGQQDFGENYLQEALEKVSALQDLALCWHFIGPVQSNKTRDIAANFDWVHSVDRLKIARRLSEQRSAQLSPLNICLQINIDNEESKSGAKPVDMIALAEDISLLPNLQLRGMMVIPQATTSIEKQNAVFQRSYHLYQQLQARFSAIDTLSMGMSGDLQTAIQHGSTMVRIGTALFGQRHTQSD